jgi:hypothetical protein
MIRKFINVAVLTIALGALGVAASVAAQSQGQKSRTPLANAYKEAAATQQPLYSDYKGVRIGMTAAEARAKLGLPALKEDDQDFYVFSDKETAQLFTILPTRSSAFLWTTWVESARRATVTWLGPTST